MGSSHACRCSLCLSPFRATPVSLDYYCRGRVTALEKDGREELLSCGRLRFAIHGPAPSIANSIQTALAFSAVEGHLSNPSW